MKTIHHIMGVDCIEVRREIVRKYIGTQAPSICTYCPAHTKGDNCALTRQNSDDSYDTGCPVDEILVPVDIAHSPEFVAALLEVT